MESHIWDMEQYPWESISDYSKRVTREKEKVQVKGCHTDIYGNIDTLSSTNITCGSGLYGQTNNAKSIWDEDMLKELSQYAKGKGPIEILEYTTFITIKTNY